MPEFNEKKRSNIQVDFWVGSRVLYLSCRCLEAVFLETSCPINWFKPLKQWKVQISAVNNVYFDGNGSLSLHNMSSLYFMAAWVFWFLVNRLFLSGRESQGSNYHSRLSLHSALAWDLCWLLLVSQPSHRPRVSGVQSYIACAGCRVRDPVSVCEWSWRLKWAIALQIICMTIERWSGRN